MNQHLNSNIILVFDMDGVILDSMGLKNKAFLELFSDYPDKKEVLTTYMKTRGGGVNRRITFAYIFEHILEKPFSEEHADELSTRYSQKVHDLLDVIGLVPGIKEFLEKKEYYTVVNSATPQEEIKVMLARKGIDNLFDEFSGYPVTKAEALQKLQDKYPEKKIVFFGDAKADYEAALKVGVSFIAVCKDKENSVFKDITVESIPNFIEREKIYNLIQTI